MKKFQRWISGVLALCLVISMVPVSALAEETVQEPSAAETVEAITAATEGTTVPTELPEEETVAEEYASQEAANSASGTCGDALTWELDDEGVLTISGTGVMNNYLYNDYYTDPRHTPWHDYRKEIKTIVIEEGVTSIGTWAFYLCSNATSVTIPESVTRIAGSAFYSCSSLTEVIIPNGVTVIENSAFYGCNSLQTVVIPDSVTGIELNTFRGCTSLGEIAIPDSVTTIGSGVFSGCSSLTSVALPNGISTIAYETFQNCSSLTEIVIPESVTSIGYYAFSGCKSLTELVIPAGVWTIDQSAFSECTGLTRITLPASLGTLGQFAFRGCSGLKNIELPGNLATISKGLFYECTGLNSVTIPDRVKTIGESVFYKCTGLKNITIPVSVTAVQASAFRYCSALSEVYYSGSEEEWETLKGKLASYNDPLKNAVVYYNGEIPVYTESVLYYMDWEEAENRAYFGRDGMLSYGVTAKTDKAFLDDPTELEGRYVLVESLSLSGGESLLSVTVLNSRLGTVSEQSPTEIVINGHRFGLGTELSEDYEGKYVLYHTKNAQETVLGVEVLQVGEGVLDSYFADSAVSVLFEDTDTVKLYYLNPLTDDDSRAFLKQTVDTGIVVRFLTDSNRCLYRMMPVAYSGESSFLAFNNSIMKYSFQYDESWFDRSSYGPYNHDLTKMSLRIAMAAGDTSVTGKGSDMAIRDLMDKLDFSYSERYSTYPDPLYDTVGFGIGSKTIMNPNGECSTLIMIGVRGRGYGAEWGGNFRMGLDMVDHEGFRIAADRILEALENYIQDNQNSFFPNVKVWVCGFSRAAATANLVAASLVDGRLERVNGSNVYAYCFACPQNTTDIYARTAKYVNIVNVINPSDLVPKVAMSATGFRFQRYGRDHVLPSSDTAGEYKKLKKEMSECYLDILQYSLPETDEDELEDIRDDVIKESSGQNTLYEWFVLDLATAVQNREFYYHNYQDLVMKVFASGMGGKKEDIDLKIAISELEKILPKMASWNTVQFGLNLWFGYMTNAHNMELYMAWLESIDEVPQSQTTYRRVYVNCPVDVYVYQGGELVGQISNDTPVEIEDGVGTLIDANGQKVLALPADAEYSIRLAATDDGEVTYTVTEYNLSTGSTERVVGYTCRKISEGELLTAIVENLDEAAEAEYPLILADGTQATADIDQSGSEVRVYDVSILAEPGGTVTGGGKYVCSEFAKVSASADEGYAFAGWYVDDLLISADAEYRFLVEADTIITARFIPEEFCRISMQEYVVMRKGEQIQIPVKVHPEEFSEIIQWSVNNDEVASVNKTGLVSANGVGTAYVTATVRVGKYELTANCRVDVAETETVDKEERIILDGIQLSTTKLTAELYSTDYAKLDILLKLPQNYAAAASATAFTLENRGVAIEAARFTDETMAKLFALIPLDDRTVAVVPTDAALTDAKAVQSKYVGTITVTVQGEEYTSEESLTLTVKKTLPKLKATVPAFNNFWSGQTQEIVITGATVTGISCENLPDWLSLYAGDLSLTENVPAKGGSAKLTLLVETEEWALPIETALAVKCSYKAPGLKLSASSIQIAGTDSDGVQLQLLSKDKKLTLNDLGVSGISAPEGYSVSNYNDEDGTFIIKAEENFQPGKINLEVGFNNTSETVVIPLTVKVTPVTLKLAPNSVTLNSATGDSAAVTVTATPADYRLTAPDIRIMDAAKQDKTDSGELKLSYENGRLSISTTDLTPDNAKYTLYINAEGGKEAALKISTTNAEPTLKLKATGNLDLSFPEQKISLTTTFKNHSGGNLKAIDYTVTESSGKTVLDEDSKAIQLTKDGADLFVQLKETAGINIKNTYTLNLKLTLADDSVLESSVKIPVKQTAVNLKLSASKLTLNKAIDDKASVTVTCATKGYNFTEPVWTLLDSKGREVEAGILDVAWADGKLTVATTEATPYGGSYKLQISPEEGAKAVTLSVVIPAETKSTVTGTLKVAGNLDVIRDGTALTITPTWKNCNDADHTEELKIFCGDEDVTEHFVITEENGKYVLTRSENLDHSLKYTVVLIADFGNGVTAEAKAALKLKMGSAKLTVNADSTTLFANDRHSRVNVSFASTDSTLNKVAKVELDPKLQSQYEIFDYGNGEYAIGFKDETVPAKITSANISLNVWLEGNETAKANASLKVKLSIAR